MLACGTRESGPLSPGQALRTFRIAEGFRIELFAAEPHVVDPVEMVFDESGGVYVAELLDNPDDPPEGEAPLSRIKYLEDTDGDGRIDTHTVFADRLLAVEGVAPWKGGLIATAAPDILYLKDVDGDRKADVREVLYTGFALAHVEGRLSNPRLGMDNWFYVVNNSYPGEVVSPQRPDDPPVSVRSREFRFHPLRGLAEASTGGAQFGQTYNQWGHWFISHNTVHLRHTVIPPGYLDRNPFLPVESTAEDISDHGRPAAAVFPISRPQQWRIDRTRARQARYDETQPGRVEQLEGFFTASSGATRGCVSRGIRRQGVRRRRGGEPRTLRHRRPGRPDLHGFPMARDLGLPRLDRPLVPPRELRQRAGWKPVRGRLLPAVPRASDVHSRCGQAAAGHGLSRRGHDGKDLPDRRGRAASPPCSGRRSRLSSRRGPGRAGRASQRLAPADRAQTPRGATGCFRGPAIAGRCAGESPPKRPAARPVDPGGA